MVMEKIGLCKELGIEIFFEDYPFEDYPFEDYPVDIRDLIHHKIPTIIKDAPYNQSFPYPLAADAMLE
ncbi:hypothetical protein [Pasteuria penetrans]|uniref:hypothetical protein n=1 Tax=Pasteuria penetrans TaxID=86005 RepID=UPI001CAA66BD|nr:hypothetical protein [Pasteuria penetrans]